VRREKAALNDWFGKLGRKMKPNADAKYGVRRRIWRLGWHNPDKPAISQKTGKWRRKKTFGRMIYLIDRQNHLKSKLRY